MAIRAARWTPFVRAALVAGATACATDRRPTGPAPVASVEVISASDTLVVGQTAQFTAVPRDGAGQPLGDRPVTWQTSAPDIATVSGDGLVAAVTPGEAVISATAEDRTGTLEITVRTVPVASVTVDPGVAALVIGGTIRLTATARDANGQPLADRPIAWATSNASVLSVDADGDVTANAAGLATITASSEGRQRRVDITVCATTSLFITGVFPAALGPGVQGTIAGCNFSPSVAANTVLLDGRALTVQSASANELRVLVPSTGYSCEPSRMVTLALTSGTGSTTRSQRLATGVQHALGVGESVTQLDLASIRCNELISAGARYVISVFNTTAAPSAQTSVQLRGAGGAPVVPLVTGAVTAPQIRLSSPPARRLPALDDRAAARRRAHSEVLEENRAILRRFGNHDDPTRRARHGEAWRDVGPVGLGARGDSVARHRLGRRCGTGARLAAGNRHLRAVRRGDRAHRLRRDARDHQGGRRGSARRADGCDVRRDRTGVRPDDVPGPHTVLRGARSSSTRTSTPTSASSWCSPSA